MGVISKVGKAALCLGLMVSTIIGGQTAVKAQVPTATPDEIYYTYPTTTSGNNYEIGLNGSNLTNTTTPEIYLACNAAGKLIYLIRDDSTGNSQVILGTKVLNGAGQVVQIVGTQATTFPSQKQGPSISPDGTKFAYYATFPSGSIWPNGVYIKQVGSDPSLPGTFLFPGGGTFMARTSFNYDGTRVAGWYAYNNLSTINVDGTGLTAVPGRGCFNGSGAFYSPTSNEIAISEQPNGSSKAVIRIINGTTGAILSTISHLTGSTGLPSWSPDGQKVCFALNNGTIWKANKDGSGQTQVIGASGGFPAWSPPTR